MRTGPPVQEPAEVAVVAERTKPARQPALDEPTVEAGSVALLLPLLSGRAVNVINSEKPWLCFTTARALAAVVIENLLAILARLVAFVCLEALAVGLVMCLASFPDLVAISGVLCLLLSKYARSVGCVPFAHVGLLISGRRPQRGMALAAVDLPAVLAVPRSRESFNQFRHLAFGADLSFHPQEYT